MHSDSLYKITTSACKHYLNQGVFRLITLVMVILAQAVAAVEVLQHGGDCERQKQQPDDDRDLRRLLESSEEILSTGVHHVKIPVDGSHREEGDAGPSVQKQHEEHCFAHCVIRTPPLTHDEVVRLDGQTEEQEDVSQHQVEKEDIVGVGFPELQHEYEEVDDGYVQRQSQEENNKHDSRVEFIQANVRDITVLNMLVFHVA